MERILGIDTGTNSLGWAIVERDENQCRLLYRGTHCFSEGVKIEKGIESSKASERTEHRSARKHYWRRKIRKIRLLTILSANNLCPHLSKEELHEWRTKRAYPMNEAFLAWQRTEDKEDINPYHFRHICLTQKLDLSDPVQRHILGRALYHLNQRRGFLSNRKDNTKESEGAVKKGIDTLSEAMQAEGCQYLGEYFYRLYQRGERIRTHYTHRKDHYLTEFHAICKKQELEASLVTNLEEAIFYQRPLKSQKGTVGTCTFEKGKARCSASHPLYEDFRMYQFLNNVKIKTPADAATRPLNREEFDTIIPLFKRKSKRTFLFEDIAKKLAGKGRYGFEKDNVEKPCLFNYPMDTSISGSIVNAQLEDIFGENWLDAVCEVYTLAEGKSRIQIMNDIWHALFFFDDEDKLKEFAMNRLQLNDEEATKFSKISLPNDYASLSLKAIRKILYFMKSYGLLYSDAAFLANLEEVLPHHIWNERHLREAAIELILEQLVAYNELPTTARTMTKEQWLKDYLIEQYQLDNKTVSRLYHPSMIDLYPHARPNDESIYQLGSPRISSVRNPMAMHSLFRLRKVVNLLLRKGLIDKDTTINIEFARGLNDANRRKAIQDWQRENEKKRLEYKKKIEELTGKEASDTDILKYQLWEEQNHKCIYTGKEICITDFLGDHPRFDIEHTVPQSVGGDSTQMNLTLCDYKFNREVKRAKLPAELPEHEVILQRIASWKEKFEDLEKQIRKQKGKRASTKEEKDKIIRQKHLLSLQRDYWRGKYDRFTMTEVPEGFSRRQGTDISVISRYARLYMKSVFKHVYIVKGIATSDFRKLWGIQEEYEKKARVNHVHHCIDAITIACISKSEYGKLAKYYHEDELQAWDGIRHESFPKPWPSFTEDVKAIQDELLISHYNKDNVPKRTRKHIRMSDGSKVLAQGDTARVQLHLDTFYGAIQQGDEIKYVVRKNLDSIDEKDVKNIVDNRVREIIETAMAQYGGLKEALKHTIWMNEEKGIPINKVRLLCPSVVRPIELKKQRDRSHHDYKRQYYVANDRNYMMAIYIGRNEKGKEKREFELVNSLTATKYFKSNKGLPIPDEKKGLPLVYVLKVGTMVLLYENNPEEVWEQDAIQVQKRLYRISGLSSTVISSYIYGVLTLIHHQEARPSTEVNLKNGAYISNEDFRPGIKMLHTQLKALIQGMDFEINELGEIRRLR